LPKQRGSRILWGLAWDELMQLKLKAGRGIWGVELKLIDDAGQEVPRDGKTAGLILVRGPWIASGYFKNEGGTVLDADGWFPTGDIATLDADGYLQLVDRAKDVIKSGGEWISSIDVENAAMGHPAVAEAAVIGVSHPTWQERPLLIVVKRGSHDVTRDELLKFLGGKMVKWWVPDDVVFVDELPRPATGKFSKLTLRRQFRDYRLPDV
jgi:fatty-acyl-CoA synthase